MEENSNTETQPHFKKPRTSETNDHNNNGNNNNNNNLRMKTQICRRFMQGMCFLGSKCNYAHGFSDLRTTPSQPPKLCRMFLYNKHCTYGHACRFLHHHPQQQQQQPQLGMMQNAGSRIMQTSAAATTDGYSSAPNNIPQTSTNPATNASPSTAAPIRLHKNGPYAPKCEFKKVDMQRISRIYADWISDDV